MRTPPVDQMKTKDDFLNDDGELDGEKAYGAVIGTFLVCSWVEIVLAFIRPTVRMYILDHVGGGMGGG